jgi:probable phosphomutase (TIGR03848 family)
MARLFLVRHAPTPETGTKLTGRLPGVSLGAKGEEVAAKTAGRLEGVRFEAFYTSPIERTRETADIVAAPHGLKPIIHDGVIEADFGTWQGRSLASLRKLKLWNDVVTVPSQTRFPGGESFPEMQTRAVTACNDIAAKHGKATVAIVSHSDVIKSIVAHYVGTPLDLFQRINISPASVSVIHVPRHGPPFVGAVNSYGEFK